MLIENICTRHWQGSVKIELMEFAHDCQSIDELQTPGFCNPETSLKSVFIQFVAQIGCVLFFISHNIYNYFRENPT